ncbi:hypothetical protein LIER_11626 [Lithospermum erythrorhizon]|uniref:Retrotransposon gag domain-containing protein n=1 Tax=Lithospermum erythrorhizon TaxID=34254 RepID=A0AAV3PNS4_LITER
MPTTASRRECKTKISFTDRLDVVPLPKGFVLHQSTQFGRSGDPIKHLQAFSNSPSDKVLEWYMTLPLKSIDTYKQTTDAFIAKFGSAIQAHQDERALMDIEQGSTEFLKSYQKRYNDILLTIPEVNNKVAYMAFYKELRYGKLKKALVLEKPLSTDHLTGQGPNRPENSLSGKGFNEIGGNPSRGDNMIPNHKRDCRLRKKDIHNNNTIHSRGFGGFSLQWFDWVSYPNRFICYCIPYSSQDEIPYSGGIGKICGDQNRAHVCYQTLVPPLNKGKSEQGRKRSRENHKEVNTIRNEEEEDYSPKERDSEKKGEHHEEVEEIPFEQEKADKTFQIRTMLGEEHKQRLIALVREYADVFAWGLGVFQE